MKDELSISLLGKFRKSKSHIQEIANSSQSFHRQSVRIKLSTQTQKQQSSSSASEDLSWQRNGTASQKQPSHSQKHKSSRRQKMAQSYISGRQRKAQIQRTLNDMFFNLAQNVQRILYIVNIILNVVIRIAFINLLAFLATQSKWVYLQVFLSLEALAIIIYFIVMIKLLFTRSDKESVYFQKIFNQQEWADIQSQRVMRTHFNLAKILSKIGAFFNPCTKFQKNIKISFLRQQLFKRMEMVLVYVPFSLMFFLRQDDFVSEGKPNFNLYISAGICLQAVRAASTYLIVYIYN